MNEDEYVRNIGLNLKEIRNRKGMTQETLAAILGTEDSAVRRIEAGRTNPTIKSLFRIARALNVDVEELIKSK